MFLLNSDDTLASFPFLTTMSPGTIVCVTLVWGFWGKIAELYKSKRGFIRFQLDIGSLTTGANLWLILALGNAHAMLLFARYYKRFLVRSSAEVDANIKSNGIVHLEIMITSFTVGQVIFFVCSLFKDISFISNPDHCSFNMEQNG